MLRIYLAGPNVFYRDPKKEGERLVACCKKHGFEGLFPLDNEVSQSPHVDKAIFEANVQLIDSADLVIANLMPFRGPESDIGTVWEVAYAYAHKKPVHGYSHCGKALADKIPNILVDETELRCENDWAIEDFNNPFNLMLMHSLTSFTVGDLEDVLVKLKALHP